MESTAPQLAGPKRHLSKAHSPRPAGFFSRFEAFIVDLIILGIAEIIGSVFISYILKFFSFLGFVQYLQTWLQNFNNNMSASAVSIALLVIAYVIFFWSVVGYTPGKALIGLKIVRLDGKKLSFGRSLVRFFSYWISAIPFFLGFFWVLWDSKRQGWHDKIAGTQVVYLPRKPHQ